MKYETEIEYEKVDMILDMLADYSMTSDKYDVLIYGQGAKPRSFYDRLKSENDIELLWTGWSGPSWTVVFSFIPGQSGLVRLKNRKRLKEFYNEIGEQSYCGLYFVDKNTAQKIIDIVTTREKTEISKLIENTDDNFMFDVYFDYHGGQRDGEVVYKIVYTGRNVDPRIVGLLSAE
jgi:hypothetical protein